MRRARITYPGAFHHVMNRGIEGKNIFLDNREKNCFLEMLLEKSQKLRIRLLSYCIMNNHYHLVLQNSSGLLSDFMRQLNGEYGMVYRKRKGGRGYVFQNRYQSTIIQEGAYLKMVIIYVLLNPVRAGKALDPYKYEWSSIGEYFVGENSSVVDNRFVEEVLQNREEMEKLMMEWITLKLPIRKTRFGNIIGSETFTKRALKQFNRRKEEKGTRRMRRGDYIFEPLDEVIRKFEEEKGVKIEEIDTRSFTGKSLRSELLVLLKERVGLKYNEIIELPLFRSLKYSSLGQLYKRVKDKMDGEK